MRKRFIEDTVRGFLAGGGTQVVILGAGLDTLASRLAHQFSHVDFIEVDHPATQRRKRRALDAIPARNLRLHAADLSRTPVDVALGGVATFEVRLVVHPLYVLLAEWNYVHRSPPV